jgi:hypothetical protein
MLLRSITHHVKQQNWFAVWVDFVIVVVGVFVGLQAQEWSNDRADRNAERAAIGRLIVEYQQNLEILEADKEESREALAATEALLSMIALGNYPEEMDEGIAQTILSCLQNAKFVPALGTTNSLMASGDLNLIGDPEIQKALSQWPALAQVLIEWQEIERTHGEELILQETFEYVSWPTLLSLIDDGWQASPLANDLDGFFSSRRLEGLLTNRRYNTRESIGRIETLEAETRSLVERLQARLRTISAD